MSIDSEKDLKGLERIGRIVGQTLQEMKNKLRPGMTTGELDQIGGAFLYQFGARSAPKLVYNFPGFTCISLNDEAAHGIPGSRVIQPGDLVNMDVSAELDGYFADSAITVPIPPTTPLQQRMCMCTQAALQKAIASVRAGLPINVIGKAVEGEARRCGFNVLRDLSGHGVGRSIHEEPHSVDNFFNRRDTRRLNEGLVLTIEPFLTNGSRHVVTGPDGWTLRTPDGSLTVQYEHTIVVTRQKPIVITAYA